MVVVKIYFSHILRRYEKEYEIERDGGSLIDGRWVDDDSTFFTDLTVMPYNPEEDVEYEGGSYERQWKKVFIRENNPNQIQKNDIIVVSEDDKYEIKERTSWLDFADFQSWIARKIVVEG